MSAFLQVGTRRIELDDEGFLRDLADWDLEVAAALAEAEGLELTAERLEILQLLRQFYAHFQLSPAMRPLVKYVGQQLGADKGKSIYLLQLFPGSPAKLGSKLAGLPKPDNCL